MVEELGGRVEKVVVDSLEEHGEGGTYTADLHLATPRGSAVIDARPSDSLALAARTEADIEVDPAVYEDGRRERTTFDDLDDIREVADL